VKDTEPLPVLEVTHISEPFSEALEATALMQPLASGVGVAVALAVEVAVALADAVADAVAVALAVAAAVPVALAVGVAVAFTLQRSVIVRPDRDSQELRPVTSV
jgi:hypothetical protein